MRGKQGSTTLTTYRVHDEQILLQLFLAVGDFAGQDVLTPRCERLPLAEEGKRGDLDESGVEHVLLFPAVQLGKDRLVGLHVGDALATYSVIIAVVDAVVIYDPVNQM